MVNTITLFFILLLLGILTLNSYGITHPQYFEKYQESVGILLETKYKGPISKELAVRALGRQTLEDGISRKPTNSVAGISVGEPNKSIVLDSLLGVNMKVGTASDAEGGTFYSFDGDFANIYSAFIIGRLFDVYIEKFLKKDKRDWVMSKETSRAIDQDPDSFELNHRFYCRLRPERIIEKGCGLYGPGKGAVDDIVRRSISNDNLQ